MSADDRVKSENASGDGAPGEPDEQRPRWWLRNPAMGVLAAAVLGIATVSVTSSFEPPESTAGSTLLYLVILPIALLLPAIAVAGAFIAWRAYGAARGNLRLVLAVPAAIGMLFNVASVGLFLRWLVQVFIR